MKTSRNFLVVIMLLFLGVLACEHDPVLPQDPATGGDGDTGGGDNPAPGDNPVPCDPDSVYFESQIKPIFISNCAISGCHDASSAEDGVILDSYANIIREIDSDDPLGSDLYEVLVDDDPDKLMPRNPNTEMGVSLPQAQIDLVRDWIQQGYPNNSCDDCDSTVFSYSGKIEALINQNCATSISCHGAGSTNGDYTTYAGLKAKVDNGTFERRVLIDQNMPPAAPLPACDQVVLRKWLEDGALNN